MFRCISLTIQHLTEEDSKVSKSTVIMYMPIQAWLFIFMFTRKVIFLDLTKGYRHRYWIPAPCFITLLDIHVHVLLQVIYFSDQRGPVNLFSQRQNAAYALLSYLRLSYCHGNFIIILKLDSSHNIQRKSTLKNLHNVMNMAHIGRILHREYVTWVKYSISTTCTAVFTTATFWTRERTFNCWKPYSNTYKFTQMYVTSLRWDIRRAAGTLKPSMYWYTVLGFISNLCQNIYHIDFIQYQQKFILHLATLILGCSHLVQFDDI